MAIPFNGAHVQPGSSRGFTLIELMIAVVVLGVLVAIAAAKYHGFNEDSKSTEAQTVLRHLYTMEERHRVRHGTYTDNFAELEGAGDPVERTTYFEFRIRVDGDGFVACAAPVAKHAYLKARQIDESGVFKELAAAGDCTGNLP